MENMEKEKTPQEWEAGVLEAVADGDELQLIEMAQDAATHLTAELATMKAMFFDEGKITKHEQRLIRARMARVAVLMDALQLRYGDCANEELSFLQYIDGCLEKE